MTKKLQSSSSRLSTNQTPKVEINKKWLILAAFMVFAGAGYVVGSKSFKKSSASAFVCREDNVDAEVATPGDINTLSAAKRLGRNTEESVWIFYISGTQFTYTMAVNYTKAAKADPTAPYANPLYFDQIWLPSRIANAKKYGTGKIDPSVFEALDHKMTSYLQNPDPSSDLAVEIVNISDEIVARTLPASIKNRACYEDNAGGGA
jgi:hypothetical protein